MIKRILLFSLLIVFTSSYAQETHIKNLQKLTFGGDNAEAYFSPDGSKLIMQVSNPEVGTECDQIFLLHLNDENYTTDDLKLISTGQGRTTCAFFMPDGEHVIYASTHGKNKACPPEPAPREDGKYVWPIYEGYDIYMANLEGEIVKKLTDSPGYDAEAVVSPDGKKIAFTSLRSGDLEIYVMDIDGSNITQVTDELGYDGGAFFTHDSKCLIFRSSRPQSAKEKKEYKQLLKEGLITPTEMELYMADIDGTNMRKVTDLGKANWSPYMLPTDDRIIFSSNHHSTVGYDFQLYAIDPDGSNLEQITFNSRFNAFPMFSPDGEKIVFSSNRNQDKPHDTNVFIADWVPCNTEFLVKKDNLKKHVEYLASDKLKGRLSGSKGEKMAANYIIEQFKKANVEPYYGDSYTDEFDYKVKLNPHSDGESVSNTGINVAGFLDNGADKTIVIGAHYDHLGLNQHHNSSMANSEGKIHNGADDNASGVAGAIELARIFSQNKHNEKANYLFTFFSAEEDGLIGSKEFVENIDRDKYNIIAMINMDMIGRLNNNKELTVGGVGTSDQFTEIVKDYKPAGFNLAIDSSGSGPSDHTSFYLDDIPVLFFFTGTHEDYHKPSDDAYKLNYTGLKNIVTYIEGVSKAIASLDSVPFHKTKTTSRKPTPDYKVTLGIMPNYAGNKGGLKVDGVINGRPAFKAGLEQGDIITQIGTCEVSDIYAYMECLAKFNLGDTAPLKYKRDGKEYETKVTF